MREALLIYNPVAGTLAKAGDDLLPKLCTHLEAGGVKPTLAATTLERPAQMIAAEAAKAGQELVIVAGGDGTVSDTAKALIGTQTTLGIIPLGTFNNLARSMGISFEPETACDQIVRGTPSKIDVGRVNGKHYFFEVAGIGLDAALFPLAEDIKGGAWVRYFEAAGIFSRFSPFRVSISLDHEHPRKRWIKHRHNFRVRAWMILCANAPYYGPGCEVSPSSSLQDRLLTVHLFRNVSRLGIFFNLLRRIGGAKSVKRVSDKFTVRRIDIKGDTPQPIHIDGNIINEWPLTIESIPAALTVLRGEPGPGELAKEAAALTLSE